MDIYEVIDSSGPVVFANEEVGILITASGSYFNWWTGQGRYDGWVCTDSRATGLERGLYEEKATLKSLMERAEKWFNEVMNEAKE